MDNSEYLERLKKDNFKEFVIKEAKADLESRKLIALEIIAEELINVNSNLCNLVTTLEDIETAIKQRQII